MTSLHTALQGLRALHVVSSITQDSTENWQTAGEDVDQRVVELLVGVLNETAMSRGIPENARPGFAYALMRDPLIAAFCIGAHDLSSRLKGEIQAEIARDHMTRSYIVKIGLFYTPAQLMDLRKTPAPAVAQPHQPAPPVPATPPARRLSFRGLKSISTGVADPKNRP